ncbi:MAG: hypothetical protein HYW69_01660 [Candidatus Nealsonbacteria bacterium]|nr:hypothetical protein [Candidatus Nealsonbacteria bacterium]
MRTLKKLKSNIPSLFLISSLFFFSLWSIAAADHLTPERVIENKYTVILLMIPDGEQMNLRFFFRDANTGKNIIIPIAFRISIAEDSSDSILLDKKEGKTANGIIELPYKFPSGGLYKISLEFEKAGEDNVYRPDPWTLWVPGATKNFFQRYPIGRAEIAGFALFFSASGIVIFSILWKRAKGKPIEISFFGIFSDKDKEK